MLRPRRVLALGAPIVLAFVLVSAAAAFDVPIVQLRSLAQTYEPGVFLPTALPSTVTKVDIGAASGIGNGPAPVGIVGRIAPDGTASVVAAP